MSALAGLGTSVANAIVPPAVAAFVNPPLPEDLGLIGQIADERIHAENADGWRAVAPWMAGILAFTGTACLVYGLVRRPQRRSPDAK